MQPQSKKWSSSDLMTYSKVVEFLQEKCDPTILPGILSLAPQDFETGLKPYFDPRVLEEDLKSSGFNCAIGFIRQFSNMIKSSISTDEYHILKITKRVRGFENPLANNCFTEIIVIKNGKRANPEARNADHWVKDIRMGDNGTWGIKFWTHWVEYKMDKPAYYDIENSDILIETAIWFPHWTNKINRFESNQMSFHIC